MKKYLRVAYNYYNDKFLLEQNSIFYCLNLVMDNLYLKAGDKIELSKKYKPGFRIVKGVSYLIYNYTINIKNTPYHFTICDEMIKKYKIPKTKFYFKIIKKGYE